MKVSLFAVLLLAFSPTIGNMTVQQTNTPVSGACDVRTSKAQVTTKADRFDSNTDILSTHAQKVFVTSDVTDSTSGTLKPITGLSWALPYNIAGNYSFHCSLMFNQATAAVSDQFGVGVDVAPTQLNAAGQVFSGASGPSNSGGTLTGLNTTTPTAIVTFTPNAITTVWSATLDGTVEVPSSASQTTLQMYMATATGADNLVVKRGSYCILY